MSLESYQDLISHPQTNLKKALIYSTSKLPSAAEIRNPYLDIIKHHNCNPSHPTRPLTPIRQPKHQQPIRGQHAQAHGDGLAQLDRARDGAAAQHGRRQQAELLAVGLAVAQPQQTEQVERADGEAGGDGGDRARAGVADHAAEGGQEGEGSGGGGGEFWGGLLID